MCFVRWEIADGTEMGRWGVEHKADIKPRGFGRTEPDVKQQSRTNGFQTNCTPAKIVDVSIPPLPLVSAGTPGDLLRPKRRDVIRHTVDWLAAYFSRPLLLPLLRNTLGAADPRSPFERDVITLFYWLQSRTSQGLVAGQS